LVGCDIVGALVVVGAAVVGVLVVGAAVVGVLVVGAAVVGVLVVGAAVVGVLVVGTAVVGVLVVGATVGAAVVGAAVVGDVVGPAMTCRINRNNKIQVIVKLHLRSLIFEFFCCAAVKGVGPRFSQPVNTRTLENG
jgi:hypothetical protein